MSFRSIVIAAGMLLAAALAGGQERLELGAKVVEFAQQRVGTKYGDGECATLAIGALKAAGAKLPSDLGPTGTEADYVWGELVAELTSEAADPSTIEPGDVIQFRDVQLTRKTVQKEKNGASRTHSSSESFPHHTAIVESVKGNFIQVFQQNVAAREPARTEKQPDAPTSYRLIYETVERTKLSANVMKKLVDAVARRINPDGTKDFLVRPDGGARVEVVLSQSNAAELAKVKDAISRAGTLEFSVVVNSTDHAELLQAGRDLDGAVKTLRNADKEIVARWLPVAPSRDANGKASPNTTEFSTDDSTIAVRKIENQPAGSLEVLILQNPPEERVTGEFLTKVILGMDNTGSPAVDFTLNDMGARRLESLSRKYQSTPEIQRRLAIVYDGQVLSAPTLRSVISRQGQISGLRSRKSVEEMVQVLRAGPLPVELSREPVSEVAESPEPGGVELSTLCVATIMVRKKSGDATIETQYTFKSGTMRVYRPIQATGKKPIPK